MTDTSTAPRQHRWRVIAWSAAACLWLLPLLAMQFTDEVKWTGFDFAVFGAMLAVSGGVLEVGLRRSPTGMYGVAVGVAVIAAFFLTWINGAVGIIGSENNPANLLFLAVPAVALIGSVLARGLPGGMVIAMAVAAAAQALVPLAATVVAPDISAFSPGVIVLTVFFCGLWLLSAALFRACSTRDD